MKGLKFGRGEKLSMRVMLAILTILLVGWETGGRRVANFSDGCWWW